MWGIIKLTFELKNTIEPPLFWASWIMDLAVIWTNEHGSKHLLYTCTNPPPPSRLMATSIVCKADHQYLNCTKVTWCEHSVAWCYLLYATVVASSPDPSSPRGEAWYTLFVHARNIPSFEGICKIANAYRTLVAYTNRACSFHANKRESGCTSEQFLLAKVVSCAVSVVKTDCVQGGAATYRVQRETSISVAVLNGPLW